MLKKTEISNFGKTCFGIIVLGIFTRILFYSYNRPFWNDECALALNLSHFSFLNCFKTLSYGQAAPPLFLIVAEFFSKIIPAKELSLRFFPLVSSILSIFVFYDLSKKVLNKKITRLFALILFCFNYQLIYYGQEFKQYSSDVLIFITILLSYFYLDFKSLTKKKLSLLGLAYSFCIWCSFTSVFAIFSVLFSASIKSIKEYKKLFIIAIPVLISFILFCINQNHLASSTYLHAFWKTGFINPNFDNLYKIINNYFIFFFNNWFLFIFFIIGLILNLKNIKNEKSQIIFVPFLLAIILSYFSVYPLSSRISLYLIPTTILFIVKILDYINFKNKLKNYIISLVLIFLGCLPAIIKVLDNIYLKNYEYEDILTPLNIASKEIKQNDILYISDGAKISFEFYKDKFKFKNVVLEKERIIDSNAYKSFLDTLPKNHKYYYIFCHFPNKKQRLINTYYWAMTKNHLKSYIDKSFNALIIFYN